MWDPFCGSGTILLETLSMLLDTPLRMDFENNYFDLWKLFPKEKYIQFKNTLIQK